MNVSLHRKLRESLEQWAVFHLDFRRNLRLGKNHGDDIFSHPCQMINTLAHLNDTIVHTEKKSATLQRFSQSIGL